jgi:hypothetical protein
VLATLAATALVKTLAVLKIARLMHLQPTAALPWQTLAVAGLCAALAAAPALWLLRAWPMPPVATLLMVTPLYGLCYLALHRLAGLRARPAIFASVRSVTSRPSV